MAAETHNPLEQFTVSPILHLPQTFGIDPSLTNSSLVMLIAVAVAGIFFAFALRKRAIVPGRMQSLAEVTYQFVHGVVEENAGTAGQKYFPFIFTLFLFILSLNLLGLLPYSFAPTSHIILTLGMGAFVFLSIVLIAIIKQGPIGFLKHFAPEGMPIILIPVVVPIEMVSYLSRPFSLGIRLAANISAGHILMQVIAGFVIPLAAVSMVLGILPIVFVIGFTGFEIFVAILQAYVFTLLACLYLGEALAEHEHH